MIKIGDALKKTGFENLKELDRNKLILFALVCIIFVYLDFSLLVSAQVRGIKALGPKIGRLQKDITALNKDLAATKDTASPQAASRQSEELARSKKLIREEEIPLLLQDISDMANSSGVRIAQLRPFKDPKAKEETLSGVKVSLLTVALNLNCGYHALGRFLAALEGSRRFMAIQDLKISSNSEDPAEHDVSIVFKTYMKK